MQGEKYRVRCLGRTVYGVRDGFTYVKDKWESCGWKGVRTAGQCECYDEWTLCCRPTTPGPGCPSGVDWSCPRCKGAVTGKPVERRVPVGDGGTE